MRYTFFLYTDESQRSGMSEQQRGEDQAAFGAYIAELTAAGAFLGTDWLAPTSTATTVTSAGGAPLVQDGPFAETREQLGGYFAIEAPDLDAALELAARCPVAQFGTVEVRASLLYVPAQAPS